MPALAVHSFLGQAARPHYEAVRRRVAEAAGVTVAPLRETPLADLPGGRRRATRLLFVCGLPYTRMRDGGAPIEPLAAPVPEDEDGASTAPICWSRRARGRRRRSNCAAHASPSTATTRSPAG